MPTMQLLDRLRALGVDRSRLPDNLSDFFGTFGSERQNIIKACDFVRNSPLIGPKIPVHGLLLDIQTGGLDWIVNGYETLSAQAAPALPDHLAPKPGEAMESLGAFKDFAMGEMKFPEAKIGEAAAHLEHHVLQKTEQLGVNVEQKIAPAAESVEKVVAQAQQYADKSRPQPPPVRMRSPLPPKKNPLPPPIRPGANFRRG
jgi:carbonic anhydrase